MAIYTFSFDPKYAGHTAVVTDYHDTEVAGSPITLDADGDGTLSLPATPIFYRAQVDNAQGAFGDGYSVVYGVIDVNATLNALAGGGGGGMSADDLEYYAETDPPQTPDNWALYGIDWSAGDQDATTTLSEAGEIVLAQPGVYAVAAYVQFAAPAQLTAVELFVGGRLIGGNATLLPGSSSKVHISGALRIEDGGIVPPLIVTMRTGDAVDPVIPAINFAYMSFKKLVDAA